MSCELILPFLRPVEPLLLDDGISEIMGNPDSTWWYERDGILERDQSICFEADKLRTGLEVIANKLGKKLDENTPFLNAQLPDGSRLAAVIPPVVRPAPAMVIRKFSSRKYTLDDLIARGTLTAELAGYLTRQIEAGKTTLISGGTGSGKTTLLNILAQSIPSHERIVIIEDTTELSIQKPNILAVECQTDTYKNPISFDDLLKNALRWRPDRIILGEVRGVEARTLLDSFNTGHSGALATIHANSATKALRRFANLAMRSHQQTTIEDIEAEIGEAVHLVIHIERQLGRRTVREVIAVEGYDRHSQSFQSEPVFKAQAQGGSDMLNASTKHGPCDDPRRIIDIASARLWLEEGFPVADVLTVLEVRRRFELSAHDGRAYAVEVLWAAKEEMRVEKNPVIPQRKDPHHAIT